MANIINLTQHAVTPDQKSSGVVDFPEGDKGRVAELLTFNDLPDMKDLAVAATQLANLVGTHEAANDESQTTVMIGGAPFFMEPLARELRKNNYRVLFAFSRRESKETPDENGGMRKVAVFRHWVLSNQLGIVHEGCRFDRERRGQHAGKQSAPSFRRALLRALPWRGGSGPISFCTAIVAHSISVRHPCHHSEAGRGLGVCERALWAVQWQPESR